MPIHQLKQHKKIKRSFSISPTSDLFLRQMQMERNAKSRSETLDGLLHELMEIQQQRVLETAYTNYYDSLMQEEVTGQQSWGAFSGTQLVTSVR